MTTAALKAAIFGWVTGVTGWDGSQVIWARPNAPRPDLEYLLLELLSETSEGQGYLETGLTGTETVYQDSRIDLRIQAFGDTARDRLNALRLALNGYTHREALVDAGLARRGPIPQIRSVPAIQGTEFETRWVMTLGLGIVGALADADAGYIEQVTIDLTVYDEVPEVAEVMTYTSTEE